jgi:hypothetical protein
MAGGAVVAAAAARRRRRRHIIDTFRLADATAPNRARSLAELGLHDGRDLGSFVRDGVLLPGAQPGELYLSESAYLAYRDRNSPRARRVMLLVLIALAVLLAGVVVALRPTQL